jgi:hypothetical protein
LDRHPRRWYRRPRSTRRNRAQAGGDRTGYGRTIADPICIIARTSTAKASTPAPGTPASLNPIPTGSDPVNSDATFDLTDEPGTRWLDPDQAPAADPLLPPMNRPGTNVILFRCETCRSCRRLPTIPPRSIFATGARLKYVPFDRMIARTCSRRSAAPVLNPFEHAFSCQSAAFQKPNSLSS